MYISHLDLSKTMQRIMVRADIDIWYSEGFNPQPRVVFAVPLPVGVESDCEYLDIKINSPMDVNEIKTRISKNFPDEMKVIDVYIPEVKFKNIMFIDYTIKLVSPKITENTVNEIENLFKNQCNVTNRVTDLRSFFFDCGGWLLRNSCCRLGKSNQFIQRNMEDGCHFDQFIQLRSGGVIFPFGNGLTGYT